MLEDFCNVAILAFQEIKGSCKQTVKPDRHIPPLPQLFHCASYRGIFRLFYIPPLCKLQRHIPPLLYSATVQATEAYSTSSIFRCASCRGIFHLFHNYSTVQAIRGIFHLFHNYSTVQAIEAYSTSSTIHHWHTEPDLLHPCGQA